jgi:hypothetical protein
MQGPFWTKTLVSGEDLSHVYTPDRIREMYAKAQYGAFSTYKGPLVDQMRTASSFLKHVLAIHHDTGHVHTCVNGPNGLPGGYPTRLSAKGAEVTIPDLSLEESIAINEAGARIDGIERVKDDGTVVYVEENVKLMRETLGYECPELKVSESEERARELNAQLRKLYEKHNVE